MATSKKSAPKKAAKPKTPAAKKPAAKKKKKPAKESPASTDLETLLQSAEVQDQLPEQYKDISLADLSAAIEDQFKDAPDTPGATLQAALGNQEPRTAFDLCVSYKKIEPYFLLVGALIKALKAKPVVTDAYTSLKAVLDTMCSPVTAAIGGGSPTGTNVSDVGTASEPGTPT